MLIIITTNPIQWLFNNYVIIYIKEADRKIWTGLSAVKCVSQLKTKFNVYHHIIYLYESKPITVSF